MIQINIAHFEECVQHFWEMQKIDITLMYSIYGKFKVISRQISLVWRLEMLKQAA